MATDTPQRYETTYVGPDGQQIVYESTVVGATDPADGRRRLTLVSRNVTERKRTEAALAETERQLVDILADLPGMVFRCENDADWTMRFCSEGCRDVTGYEPADLVGNATASYASLIHPADTDRVAEVVTEGLERHEQYQVTYRIRPREGGDRWVWEQGHGVFRDGRLEMIEGFIYNVSEQIEAQEKRRILEKKAVEAQKLESPGVMAGGIAHDFNNLLQTMLGFNELAEVETGPGHPANEHLGAVRIAAEAAGAAAGTIVLRTGMCHCTEEDLAANVCGAHPDGGHPAPGEFVYLEVADDGHGMDEETRQRLFEPFFTTRFIGRGLGLAAVQGIVRGHRGAVFVTSAPGVGTTMRVLFPSTGRFADVADVAEDAAALPLPDAVAGRYILVVDDEADVCRFTRTSLEYEGYGVVTVPSGREAIARVAENPDAVIAVLLDVIMPEMSGEQCLREIRHVAPAVPVIVMSGWTEVEVTARFAGQSYQGLLPKPFHTDQLLAALAAAVNSR